VTYVLGGLLLLALLLLAARWFVRADPARIAGPLLIAAAVAVYGFALVLLFAGRPAIGLALAAALTAAIVRWRRQRQRGAPGGPGGGARPPGPATGGTSTVNTTYFAMTLDHDSGALDGEILKGGRRGRLLSSLDLPALLGLLSECDDPASLQVLTAYLDRHHANWREAAAPGSAGTGAGATDSGIAMSRAEAYRILGLEPDADEAAIKAAHHRLMLKFHPDQGGSAWFAARINEARDLLIGS
jgi:hypothetical protein